MGAAAIGNIYIGLDVDIGRISRFRDAANIVDSDSRRMRAALDGSSRSIGTLQSQMNRNMRVRLFGDSLRTITRTNDEIQRLRAAFVGLAAVTGTGLTSALSGAYLLQTADRARLLSNQLRTVTSDSADLAAVQTRLYDISQRTRSGYATTVQIYARAARATEQLGLSQEKLLRMTETVQKAFAIGGATSQEASGAALQLSQGIASNRFSGDEFRSVAENAPVLLRGMAEALTKGSIGKLREMATAGKLTAATVSDAIIKASARIDAEFDKTSATVSQGMTRVDNAFLKYIGDTDQTYGVTRRLAGILTSLADNFEEVAYWASKAAVAGGSIFAGKTLSSAVKNRMSDFAESRNAVRREMDLINEEEAEIARRRQQIGAEMAKVAQGARQSQAEVGAGFAGRDHAAREAEYAAQQKVSKLERDRLDAASRLVTVRNSTVVALQKEVETGRQTVRDNAARVAAAQEAALAEERILRAKQAQKLEAAAGAVGARSGSVAEAQARVAQTKAAIEAERQLQKTRLQGEIETRQSSIVTNSMQLKSTRDKIAELRSVQDLAGFQQTFGREYNGLLKDQQRVLISTDKLRKEIEGLNGKIRELDTGAGTGQRLTAAMKQHALAVKEAEAAVAALAVAEQRRNTIAGAPVAGKSLEKKLAAEAREIERYSASVTALESKMRKLSAATSGAFDGGAARKLVAEINALDNKIALAQGHLRTAALTASKMGGGDPAAIAASIKANAVALQSYNDLEAEAAALISRSAVNTEKLISAQKRLNVLRRIGSNVLDFLGGWTGIAFIGAIAAISTGLGSFAAAQMKASERTERLKQDILDLKIAGEKASDGIDGATKSLEQLVSDEIKVKLADIADEIARLKHSQGFFAALFAFDEKNLGNIQNRLREIQPGFRRASFYSKEDQGAAGALNQIIEQAKSGKASAAELLQKLREIGERPLSGEMLRLVGVTREQITYMDQLNLLAQKYTDQLGKAGDAMSSGKGNRVGFGRYDNVDETNLYRRMYPDTLGSTAAQALEAAAKGLRDLVGFYEGTDKGRGYNETLDFGKWTGDVELTSMTLRQILALQQKMLDNPENRAMYGGIGSSAVGRYQIVSTTLKDQIKKLGLSLDDFFTSDLQDRIFDNLVRQRGRSASGLRNEWEGLRKAPDEQIMRAFDVSSTSLGGMDPGIKQFVDGLKDLNLQKQISMLDDFTKSVIQQGRSMGASTDEIKAYVEAISSGNLDAIPEKFKLIQEAMQGVANAEITKQLKDAEFNRAISFMSELQQKTIETARSFGVAEPVIRAYMAALRSGQDIPPIMAQIQQSAKDAIDTERYHQFADDVANTLGHAFDGAIGGTESWSDALRNLGLRLADLIYQLLVVEPLIKAIKAAMEAGGASNWLMGALGLGGGGGGGITSFAGEILSGARVGLFHGGRYPGNSGSSRMADPSLWVGAPRYHDGRIPGLKPDEEAAILRKNEPVFKSMDHARAILGDTPQSAAAAISAIFQIDVSGARGNAEIEEMVKSGVREGISQYDKSMPVRIGKHLQGAKILGTAR